MSGSGSGYFLRLGLILASLLAIVGGVYGAIYFVTPVPTPEVALPIQVTPSPTPAVSLADPPTATPTATATPLQPTASPTSEVPVGGIVYALSPDINSVGWVQAGEEGNHFGESYLYTGLREGSLAHGAMQFDLSFIPNGSTIFVAELELTGLVDEGLAPNSAFALNILAPQVDETWSRHNFDAIHNAVVDEALSPVLEAPELGQGRAHTFVFNAAQRSIIEQRLESNHLSFRLDSLNPEQASWFAWDSGYGEQTRGQGPVLRVGVLPPPATEVAGEAVPGSTPTPTPTFVLITSTPTPENVFTAAAIAGVATQQATMTGTPTPLPMNWVTPWAVTATPTPENTATALYQQAEATAAVIAYGTATPTPQNMVTATSTPTETPTPIFILLEGELPPMTPVAVLTKTMEFIPPELIGKIAFKSDRSGREEIYVMNPDGSGLALLTHCWAYTLAEQAETYSSDGRFRVFTKDAIRYQDNPRIIQSEQILGESQIPAIVEPGALRNDAPALYWYDAFYKVEEQLSHFGTGIAYGGVWSPAREQIAFVSNDSSDDEIWVVNRDGSNLLQLTASNEAFNAREIGKDTFIPEINKHPSWSPDGQQIVFWSTRTGHGQIWVMNTDGSNLYSLSRTGFNDFDPVWIKYPGVPAGPASYMGSLGACGPELNCSAFQTRLEAQAFYTAAGGPAVDPYGLDLDKNGRACESLP